MLQGFSGTHKDATIDFSMTRILPHHLSLPTALLCCILSACSTTDSVQLPAGEFEVVDMSGFWEKNYQLSDDFQTEFNLYLFDVQRRANPQADLNNRNAAIVIGGGSNTMESVVGLARFTEEITRMPLLEIEQDRARVRIDREEDFALLCEFYNQQFSLTETSFGSEQCGWNGEQLIFLLNLENGLSIYYQVTLSPSQQELNITTTVRSAQVATPMTISNFYRRYSLPENDIECILTLTRNNVCRRSGN